MAKTAAPSAKKPGDFKAVRYLELRGRGLHQATCAKWGYGVDAQDNQVIQYFEHGAVYAQKIRKAGTKEFRWRGRPKTLYGQWLWKPGGKHLTITEGEIDALSVSQANDLKFPTVSVPDGASSAKKAILASLDWVESFDRVVLMFDQDEPGRKAAVECAQVLTPGKVSIAHLEAKDPNELLVSGRSHLIKEAFWNAEPYRPDGVLSWDEVTQRLKEYNVEPIGNWPFHELNTKAGGIRAGEINLLGAGVGAGKSTICKQVAEDLAAQGLKVGILSLEEPVPQYAIGLAGMRMKENLSLSPGVPQEREDFWETYNSFKGQVEFYDDQGSRDIESLFAKMRYMRVALGCDVIVFDHLTIAIGSAGQENQVSYADKLMADLEALVKRTGVTVFVVMHLRKTGSGDKSHEEGGQVSLAQFRGSGQIYALSHNVYALERNQQGSNKNVVQIRALKIRHTGYTGPAGKVRYSEETGRLEDMDQEMFDKVSSEEDPFGE